MSGNAHSGESIDPGRRTILIVDDEAVTRRLLKAAVGGLPIPCQVHEALDGDSALEIARQTRPDLVLLDVVLPGSSTSGPSVCQHLCNECHTKVVIVSGTTDGSVIESYLLLGAVGHVRKPFVVAELRTHLEQWLTD